MEILSTAFYIALCVLLFSLTIAVHEFGHFIVALKLGLKVEAFSLGFGPALWKKKINGVEYRISAIPLGGYVSMPDVDPEGTKKLEGGCGDPSGAAGRIPPWKEIAVAVAGPMMNVAFAAVIAVALSLVPSARFGELPAIVGEILPGGPAEKAGLLPGDIVTAVNGNPVRTWTEMTTEIQIAGGKKAEFSISRNGKGVSLEITPERDKKTGLLYMIMAASTTNATEAGHWLPARSPLRQLVWDANGIFRVLKGLVTPREMKNTANALGGPVLIARGIYNSLRRDSWDGLGFLRFLNVNLAVLNLLPIPVLDGGLIMFSLFALVFRRRVPDRIVGALSTGFMYLLIALMGFLVFRDSMRSIRIHKAAAAATSSEAGTNACEKADSAGTGR